MSTTNILEICVLIRRKGQLLFLLRGHTGYQDGTYCTPAGHVEAGESYRQAAVREAFEEVGVRIKPGDLRHVLTTQRYTTPEDIRTGVYFEADAWEGEPRNMEPDKHDSIAWFPADDLPMDKLIPFQQAAFRTLANGHTYHDLGWAVSTAKEPA